jgi:hypothetical protein
MSDILLRCSRYRLLTSVSRVMFAESWYFFLPDICFALSSFCGGVADPSAKAGWLYSPLTPSSYH